MKSILRGTAALAALAVFAGLSAAKAADVDYAAPPEYSWSGFYIGGFVGAGASVTRAEIDAAPFLDVDFNGIGGEGLLGGAMAGFNWQVSDRFILGIQGDIAWTDLQAELEVAGFEAEAGPDFIASASLRAGYLVTPETLLYIIGGYSYSEYKLELDGGDDFDQDYDGYHVGAGMETRLTDRLTARIEYRYTEFDGEDWDTDDFLEITPSVHTGTLGIAYNLFPVAGDGQIASPVADVVEEPAASWTGLYIGANGGAGAVVNRIEIPDLADLDFDGVGGEGILGSLMAGFNWQVGSQFVLGLQGDIGLADLKSELDIDLLGGLFTLNAEAKLDWFADASLRAGWLPSPETMIYVIGGYSYAHYELDGTIALFGGEVSDDFDEDQDYNGYHVGAGIESMLTDNLTARAEYRFTQYGKEDWGIDGLDVEPSSHVGTIGLAWLFNDW